MPLAVPLPLPLPPSWEWSLLTWLDLISFIHPLYFKCTSQQYRHWRKPIKESRASSENKTNAETANKKWKQEQNEPSIAWKKEEVWTHFRKWQLDGGSTRRNFKLLRDDGERTSCMESPPGKKPAEEARKVKKRTRISKDCEFCAYPGFRFTCFRPKLSYPWEGQRWKHRM